MKTQDPSENTIKDRLKDLHKSTDTPMWSEIAQSLEQKKQKRAIIRLWSSAGFMAILALFAWLSSNNPTAERLNSAPQQLDNEEQPNTAGKQTLLQEHPAVHPTPLQESSTSKSTSAIEHNTDAEVPLASDTSTDSERTKNSETALNPNTKSTPDISKDAEITAVPKTKLAPQSTLISKTTKARAIETQGSTLNDTIKTASSSFDDDAETVTTYYYYDSKTGKQTSTKDKKVNDSIRNANNKSDHRQ